MSPESLDDFLIIPKKMDVRDHPSVDSELSEAESEHVNRHPEDLQVSAQRLSRKGISVWSFAR